MSPAEILAAARLNVVGPYLPVTWDLLARIGEWIGPAECYANGFMVQDHVDRWDLAPLHMCVDYVQANEGDEAVPEHIRLDTRRREVQHLLCDLGIAPEWARKSAVACWCAGMGVDVEDVLMAYRETLNQERDGVVWIRGRLFDPKNQGGGIWVGEYHDGLGEFGWQNSCVPSCDPRVIWTQGPETGDLGRACADLAALRARCILTEPHGYYVPLADGGIGWWAHG